MRFRRIARALLAGAAVAIGLLLQSGGPSGQTVPAGTAVKFDGINDFITFGPATGPNGLNATNFTLELWFKQDGVGVLANTGLHGVEAYPLVAKGRNETDGGTIDVNYFFGLDASGRLIADFEDMATGANHPVTGVEAITPGSWHHAAVTYDGQTWKLYLDGNLDAELTLASPFQPRSDNIQHASVGAALTSTGVRNGAFNGVIDEVRIWNVARTATEIAQSHTLTLTSGTGLIGRWGLDEGSGTVAGNSVADRPNGTLTNRPVWVEGFPFADATPPAPPQNVSADEGNGLVTLAWNANAETDLAGYNVYKSAFSPVVTTGTPLNGATPLTSPIFTDPTVTNGSSYFYVVTAIDTSFNDSSPSAEVSAMPDFFSGAGMQFDGASQYVTFGEAAGMGPTGLGAQTFTLEAWFKRTGAGKPTTTGSGGIPNAIPLITKGMAEVDNSNNRDMNYFFGISASTGRLVADFEDNAGGTNHPVSGTTAIPISTTVWHHAAVTFDGTTWRMYLDGVPEGAPLVIGNFTPRFDSIQHAAIGSALNSSGGSGTQVQGFFHGLLDEVRIWDHARTELEIQLGMNQEIFSAGGLLGRWGLNEASGTAVASSAHAINGNAIGTPTWTAGYPFPPDTVPPVPPVNLSATPGNGEVSLAWSANTEPDVVGYNLYRDTETPVSMASPPINGGTLIPIPAFIDTTVTNEIHHYYAVSAVDAFGNASGLSLEASATPSAINLPPVVNAGPNRNITTLGFATLSGSATDDGKPAGVLNIAWTTLSGPGAVSFANASSASTTATFTDAGVYVLQLTAEDGAVTVSDEMTVAVSDPVLVGAGDIAPDCVTDPAVSMAHAHGTATLLDGIDGTVFTLGDNAYLDGTAQQYANCYDQTWGRHKARTRPVSGNHDYDTPNATGYYDYFNGGGNQTGPAGDRAAGYYSYNLGSWHIVVLNSECTSLWDSNGCAAGSAQEQWLRADLAASPTNNIIAMWHRPRYSSSSSTALHAYLQPLWQVLYDFGVDISLGGHWRNYERLAPTDASGQPDSAFGIRSFVAGTGGSGFTAFSSSVFPTSEVRNNTTAGVLRLTLHDSSYDWQFIPIAGGTFTDSGTGSVHGAPSGNQPPVVAAGPDQAVTTTTTLLDGSANDEGLPGPLTFAWTKVSGPGAVSFADASAPVTFANFHMLGDYVLQLSASDGQFVRTDTVGVTVTSPSGNAPPSVDAGPDQTIALGAVASLVGTIVDDGLPGADSTTTWSRVSGPGTVTFAEPSAVATTATFSAAGVYVLRVTANDGEFGSFDDLRVTVEANSAVDFDGISAYVDIPGSAELRLATFTIEAWFLREGTGVHTSTGGVFAVPLIARGRNQSETVNVNYLLGIDLSSNVLAADFEEGAGGAGPIGANHPVLGVTPISNNTWYHAAATYDGATWRLYLDGELERELDVHQPPETIGTQHVAIGSALNSNGVPAGFFDGIIDEVRIWDRALTQDEIQSNVNQQIFTAPNLVGRWGLNEGSGVAASDSTPSPAHGTIHGNHAWVAGAPFDVLNVPALPVLNAPANGAIGVPMSPTLDVTVSDPNGETVTVAFRGRKAPTGAVLDFTLVAIPDTQHYADEATRALTFTAQTQWIVNNREALNIPFVTHLGDFVEHEDKVLAEWQRVDASMDVLDGQVPYGLSPGNHDLDAAGASALYDQFFPVSRMIGYAWYGGYLGQNQFNFVDPIDRQNKNNYELFSVGGMDFIIIHLEYDMPGYAVDWAKRVLAQYSNRRAIISTHLFLNGNGIRPPTPLDRPDGTSAAAVWEQLVRPNCNVFLVLNGHYDGEVSRTDLNACGRPVHQLLSNYQYRQNGGDGWLRYMTFKPADNKIHVHTFSPTRNGGQGEFEVDANSEFVLDYDMNGTPFTNVATIPNAPSDVNVTAGWPGLDPNTTYQWIVTVSDGVRTVTGPTWTFTTASSVPTIGDIPDEATDEDVAAGPIGFVVGDVDTALDALIVSASSSDPTLVSNAYIVLGGSGANRTISLMPEPNRWGTTTILVTVNDGTTSVTDTFALTVNPINDVPTAAGQDVSTSEDVSLDITLSAADLEEEPLTFTVIDQPVHGTLTGAFPNLNYTPAANYFGPDSFTFRVNDGTDESSLATVNLSVQSVNDAPAANGDDYSTAEDTSLTVVPSGVLANDTDVDSETLTAILTDGPSHGTLTLNVDGGFTYTPNGNFEGSDSFTYRTGDGAADSHIATVNITVTAVDDSPSISDVADQSTNEDTATSALSFTVGDPETNAGLLTVAGSSSDTTLVPNGAIVIGGSGANRTVTVTPAANRSGTTRITLTVSDGTLTASDTFMLTVAAVNDTPTMSDIVDQTIWLGVPLPLATPHQVEFTVGDVETPDGLILTATSSNQALIPDSGISFGGSGFSRTLTLNPRAGQTGHATISVTVGDGELQAVDTFVLNVEAAQPAVRIYSPNGGEKLFKKTSYVITWTADAGAAPLASFTVWHSGDNGATFAILPGCSNLGPTIRECKWTPTKATTAGLVRVVATDRANQTDTDQSDRPFTVVSGSPSISMTAPKSGATWTIGTVRTISWKHNLGSDTDAATFTVEVSRHGKDGPWEVIAARVPQLSATRGQFDWTVSGPPLKRAKFRVRATNIQVEAISDSIAIVAAH